MKIFKRIFVIVIFILWFLPAVSFAAEIFLNVDKNNFIVNEEFIMQVYLDTQDVSINATEGTVVFPSEFLKLKEIRDGNSAINFWVEKPHIVGSDNVAFSGITTGGLSLHKMFLFSLVFQSKKIGDSSVILKDIRILKNDGMGTNVFTTVNPFNFSITKISDGSKRADLTTKDVIPPENFTPFISKNPAIFNDKYFLSFSTTDKGSGVEHYEVRESILGIGGKYFIAESPYLLSDQTLKKTIYIKVVDRSGNERVIKIPAQNQLYSFVLYVFIGIILIVCIFLFKKIKRIFIF